jgi:hypothetical protein
MTQDDWIKVIGGIAGGGLMGAILTNILTSWRNRIQPVSYRMEHSRIFTSDPAEKALHARVTVLHASETFEYHNLHIAEIEIANKGGKDLGDLRFGLSLEGAKRVISVQADGEDRHHVIVINDPASPTNPKNEMDFVCRPFHRKNSYKIKLYIVGDEGDITSPGIRLSSPDAVRFTESPNLAGIIADTTISALVNLGPVSIMYKR